MLRLLILRLGTLCIACLCWSTAQAAALQVLFIGNSYTYTNDMPQLLAQLARRNGNALEVQAVTIGGASLEQHWNKGDAQRAIAARPWDVVVLQDYSLQALDQPEALRRYVRLFDERIRARGARTMLYLTWSRASAPERQAAIDAVYRGIAQELDAEVAPAGPAWLHVRQTAPGLTLYQGDGSHPTLAGSYLVAYVFYRMLFGALPFASDVPPGLTPEQHRILLRAVAAAVPGSAAGRHANRGHASHGHRTPAAAAPSPAG